MLELLKKIFPDSKTKVAALSIFSNTLLVIFKFIIGIMIGSISIISEAIHSALDLAAAVIAFISVKMSYQPPDEKHKFGHGKIENISGTIEALLIFAAAVWIIIEAVDKLIEGSYVEFPIYGILVMAISAVVNFFVSGVLMKTAKAADSVALEADALHLRTDVYTSIGVMIGLAILYITKIQIFDSIIAIIVALMIIKAAYDLIKKAFDPLTDAALPEDEENEIIKVIKKYKIEGKIIDYHKLRTRKAGADRHIDLHLVVKPDLEVQEAHKICDFIEREIKEKLSNCHVLIHVEPDSN